MLSFEDINRLFPNTFKRKEYSEELKKFKSTTLTDFKTSQSEEEKEDLLQGYRVLSEEGTAKNRRPRQVKHLLISLLLLIVLVLFVVLAL